MNGDSGLSSCSLSCAPSGRDEALPVATGNAEPPLALGSLNSTSTARVTMRQEIPSLSMKMGKARHGLSMRPTRRAA